MPPVMAFNKTENKTIKHNVFERLEVKSKM